METPNNQTKNIYPAIPTGYRAPLTMEKQFLMFVVRILDRTTTKRNDARIKHTCKRFSVNRDMDSLENKQVRLIHVSIGFFDRILNHEYAYHCFHLASYLYLYKKNQIE